MIVIDNIIKDIYINNTLYLDKFNTMHPFIKKNILYHILNNIYNKSEASFFIRRIQVYTKNN